MSSPPSNPSSPSPSPHSQSKMDASNLSLQEQRLYKLYGKLPTRSELLLKKKLKGGDRKFFDSGDYALSQAGRDTDAAGGNIDVDIVAKRHADPGDVPHHTGSFSEGSSGGSNSGSTCGSPAGSFTAPSTSPNGIPIPNLSGNTSSNNSAIGSPTGLLSRSPSGTTPGFPLNILQQKISNTGSVITGSPPKGSFSSVAYSSSSASSPLSSSPPIPISTVRPPRSPHATPVSLQPGDPSLSSSNRDPAPITATVREPSTLTQETCNDDLIKDEDATKLDEEPNQTENLI